MALTEETLEDKIEVVNGTHVQIRTATIIKRDGEEISRSKRWMHRVSKPTAASVQAQIDTHEAVCAERWKETILRIKRIETIMIGTAGTTIVLLIGVLLSE